jgi:hypothetical protein
MSQAHPFPAELGKITHSQQSIQDHDEIWSICNQSTGGNVSKKNNKSKHPAEKSI